MNNPPDLSAIAEQLCRIEHKLDLVIEHMAINDGTFPLRPMKIDQVWKNNPHRDPITLETVQYQMDLLRGHVVRITSDGTGLIPPHKILLTTPNNPGKTNGGSENG